MTGKQEEDEYRPDYNLPVPPDSCRVSKWPKIDTSGGPDSCWLYQGKTTDQGYVVVGLDQDETDIWATNLHRVIWAAYNRVDLDNLNRNTHIHHDCPNRHCMNPRHVRDLSQSDHNEYHRKRELGVVEASCILTAWKLGDSFEEIMERTDKHPVVVARLIDQYG